MPNSVSNVSFNPYGTEQGDIERKRALALALQQQSMQPIETQNAPGGWATRISPFQGLAKLAQTGAGVYGQEKANEQQKALGERSMTDYKAMVAKGLRELQGSPGSQQPGADLGGGPAQPAQPADPMAAMATFAGHPMGQALMPLAMKDLEKQQLIQALRGGAGGQPAAPNAPAAPQGNPMAPGGGSVMAPGGGAPVAPQQAPGPQMGGPAGGIPLEAWLQTDPSGKSYMQHLAQQGESTGRVYHDQNRKAYTLNKNGQRIDIPGTEAMVKPEPVNLGGATQFMDPFKQTQPMAHSLTPMQGIEAPIHLGRYQFETGQNPPALPGATPPAGGAPGPQAGGQPVPLPRPSGGLPGGSGPLTPQAQAKLAAERAEKMPSARQATELQGQDLDRLSKLAGELREHPGLPGSTGVLGAAPSMPGGSAAQAEALTTSLKAQVAGMKLQAMRNASKTGGAVGQVTEKEWPRLENMITALDPVKMGQETFQTKLDELVGEIGKVKKSINDSFKNEYGQEIGKGGLSPAEKIELETLRKKHGR